MRCASSALCSLRTWLSGVCKSCGTHRPRLEPCCGFASMCLARMQDADVRTAHLAVEERLLLRASAPWVACPAALLLPFKGRTFEIQARILRH